MPGASDVESEAHVALDFQDVMTVLRKRATMNREHMKQYEAVVARFGLDGHGERTNEQIGYMLGVSPSTADAYVKRALKAVRESLVASESD